MKMRLHWVVAFAVIAETTFAAVYRIEPLDPVHLNTKVGAKHVVEIPADISSDPVECHLTTPDGTDILITDDFEYPGFDSFSGSQADCGLNIIVTEELVGNWTLFGRSTIVTTATERRLPFSIAIEDDTKSEEEKYEPEPEPVNESPQENHILWFSPINRVTTFGRYIDITLNKIEEEEHCYFITPDGEDSTKNIEIGGVTVQESSEYVSCRITIGPMEASLIGNWTLCGKAIGDEDQERCQRVSIAWFDDRNPTSAWSTNNRGFFNHSVSFGGYLSPVIIGSGTALSCHVITPNGEDLVLTPDMDYPRIQRRDASSDVCAVTIGPIEMSTLGNWTLYGQFRLVLSITESRLPMNMFLYDEENPFTQPYNITNLDPFNRVINLNTSVTEEVTGTRNIDSCQYRAPTGQLYNFNELEHFPGVTIVDVGNTIACRITVGPVDKNMLGEWQIIGKFSNNGIFTERRQTFNIIQEDPENPIIENRPIENLTKRVFDTKIGASHRITIASTMFINRESCHIRTPSGRQYTMMEGFNVPGVTILGGSDIECGVAIEILTEDMVGEWVLISRSMRFSDPVERRLPFLIYVEEQVNAFPRELGITEGNDLYLRLENPTEQYDTCKLVGPKEDSSSNHDIDVIHTASCGFIVKTIGMSDEGIWEIVYGARIVYRAAINVSVIVREVSHMDNLTLVKDRGVNIEVGPKNAVYCKLIDPKGLAVFDDFGRCKLIIERVTMDHNGYWIMFIGTPGRVVALKHEFFVTVNEADSKAVVSTKVETEEPLLVVSCSVSISDDIHACKFRDPSGNILIANQGVGEDRFIVHGSEVSLKSELRSHECGLRITNPSVEDLGMWRCGIDTNVTTHYGFLPVVCPWLMKDLKVQASVITRPSLKADRSSVSAMEGEGVTISCSVQSAIRYCYFRSWNGTVFSVSPATSSSSMEYVGSGFDAGECGVRFKSLLTRDSGLWSCHVGLFNDTEEYRARFDVNVKEPMEVYHYIHRQFGLVVEARVNGERHLDYCRFVTTDGIGFTTDFIPSPYKFIGSLDKGHCLLKLPDRSDEYQSRLDRSPWTVAVKVRGQDSELSRQTTENLLDAERPTRSSNMYIWIILIVVGFAFIFMGISLGSKENRKWTYKRAAQIRNSIRNSFRKPKQIQNA